jgi:hypothetical protein
LAIVNIMERDITDRFVKWTGVVWFNEDKQSGTYTIRLRRAETPVRGAGEAFSKAGSACERDGVDRAGAGAGGGGQAETWKSKLYGEVMSEVE